MSLKMNMIKALGLGAAVTILTAGAALAATATSSVNVRSGPGTSYRIVDQLWPGEFVTITGHAGGWCAVSKSGPDGWVSCAYLTGGMHDRMDRMDRFDRFHRLDRGPSFGFSFGTDGFGMRVDPRPPMHPWWY